MRYEALLTGNSAPLSAKAALNFSKVGFFSLSIIMNSANQKNEQERLLKP